MFPGGERLESWRDRNLRGRVHTWIMLGVGSPFPRGEKSGSDWVEFAQTRRYPLRHYKFGGVAQLVRAWAS